MTFITSCDYQKAMTFNLQYRQVKSGIPSASGIVMLDNYLYVIGDDSAWLYQLNESYEIIDKHLLLKNGTDSIISKSKKPDFEAMTNVNINGEIELLIFGSGSKSPERDVMAKVSFKNDVHTKVYDLSVLYNSLRDSSYINSESLNIEAAAIINNSLYLFNRENNLLLEYPIDEFLGFLEGQNELPLYQIFDIKLPYINNLQAKFSGASAIANSNQLVFTSSVENSPNTYDDGEILGSYLGIIDLEKLHNGYEPQCVQLAINSKRLAIKVESVEVLNVLNPKELQLIMVTDSDGGKSEILVGNLSW